MDNFNENEKKILSRFITNIDSDIFALINLPEVVKGALFARYSRSSKSLKRLLLDEFLSKDYKPEGHLIYDEEAIKKAEAFYDRVLLGFGDDSVAELSGVHIAFENISNLATKEIEDRRIGLSPLEKSSRYVYFGKDENGKWPYYRDEFLLSFGNGEYEKIMDGLFETYSELYPKLKEYLMEKYPKDENTSDRAYKTTIKAKALDLLRGLLPASTLTNMGAFGNGRTMEYLILKLKANPLKEMNQIGDKAYNELYKVIPSFVKRAKDRHGEAFLEYLKSVKLPELEKQENETKIQEPHVKLIHYDKDSYNKILSAIVFSSSSMDMTECKAYIDGLSENEKEKILLNYVGIRKNRRHKPGRAFENVYYTFEIVANFGAYRDLQRHRILTQERQLLNVDLGYDVPEELKGTEFEKPFVDALESVKDLYKKIYEKNKHYAQYVVPFAYRLRWYITLNLREAYHLCELRSVKQGHPDYRVVAQDIYQNIKNVHPQLAKYMIFVDMNKYDLERIDAERKIDKKIKEAGEII